MLLTQKLIWLSFISQCFALHGYSLSWYFRILPLISHLNQCFLLWIISISWCNSFLSLRKNPLLSPTMCILQAIVIGFNLLSSSFINFQIWWVLTVEIFLMFRHHMWSLTHYSLNAFFHCNCNDYASLSLSILCSLSKCILPTALKTRT